MIHLTWKQAIAWHVRRQHLDERLPRARLLSLVSELCGLHAQVMSSAELTAWCRIEGLKRNDLAHHLWKTGKLIKTWAMRRTLHLLPAAEHGMWLDGFNYSPQWRPAWFAYFGVSQNELERITEAIGEVLRESGPLSREELADAVTKRTGIAGAREKLTMSWGMLLKPACYRGYLCFGPNRGTNAQFIRPETSRGAVLQNKPALRQIARKYLSTYGPATENAFVRWLHTGQTGSREMKEALRAEGVEVDIEGTKAWVLPGQADLLLQNEPPKTVRLLPAFDQYVFAAAPHSHKAMPGDFHSRIYRNQGWFSPVVLIDGQMMGVWSFARKTKSLAVTVEPFVRYKTNWRRAVGEEAERLADFMDRKLELKWI
ncbi:MAG: AlkZ family DNA glycosylase [Acidobacteriota bacterium]|nr:AlkZ family DNA glycosylase [Acidobacteriota bacterium]